MRRGERRRKMGSEEETSVEGEEFLRIKMQIILIFARLLISKTYSILIPLY